MQRPLPLDALDSKVVLRSYSWAAIGAGSVVALWSLHWIRWGLPITALTGTDLVLGMTGALLVGAGLIARFVGQLPQAVDRHEGLYALAVAQDVVLAMSFLLWIFFRPFWPEPLIGQMSWVVLGLGAGFMWLLIGWSRRGGDRPTFEQIVGLFGHRPTSPAEVLRSQYERQMRLAGAREERHRLARDLHDSIKQQIFAIQTAGATAETRFSDDPDGARAAIAQVRAAARDSMAEMDALLDQLQTTPLDNAGLTDALRRQCDAVRLRTGAEVVCEIGPLPPDSLLQPGVHMALFRVAQEALSNVARHARATQVHLTLEQRDTTLTLTIADNGAGYLPGKVQRGMGLENINARAEEFGGEAHIGSRPGNGTTVVVIIPLPDADARYFMKRALWMAGGTLLVLALAWGSLLRGRTPHLVIIGVPMALDSFRYFLAWRRARRLQRAGA